MKFSLILPAAGSGSRLGYDSPKALIELAGIPLLVRAGANFWNHPGCQETIISAPANRLKDFAAVANKYSLPRPVKIVAGGTTRQESVAKAVEQMSADAEFVLIHDAARPLVDGVLIGRVLAALFEAGTVAAVPAMPVTDTLKLARSNGPWVDKTIDRNQLFAAQTPQGMRADVARRAYRLAASIRFLGTDDVSIVEELALGEVRLVEGDPRNIKITTAIDMTIAAALLREER